MKEQTKLGLSFALTAVIAACVGGCGSDGLGEGVGVEKAAFAPVQGDVGFVQSNITTGTGPINADASFSFNSSGATNTLNRFGVGQYRVDMPNLGATVGGHVQVTGVGNGDKHCKVGGWGSNGSTLQISVNCFSNTGAAVDSFFMLNYLRRSDTPGADTAYVWAFNPSSASYDAASLYSWNSTGGANTITHTPGSNTYAVSLAGQDLSRGTVEVTAYGSGNAYCKVVGWGGASVSVACFSPTGAPVESLFTLLFSTKSPNGTPSSSYAWADQQSASSYHPSATYALGLLSVDCCSTPVVVSTPPTITRSSAGIYTVRLPGMASVSATPLNVKVTAYGSGSAACMVTNRSTSGADALVNVKCFDPLGPSIDSRFTITYSSFAFTIG